jgi:hypothetical protein
LLLAIIWSAYESKNVFVDAINKAGTALDKILFRIWYLCWNLTETEKAFATMSFSKAPIGITFWI